MLIEDIKKYNEEVKTGGIVYLIGFIVILFIGILKEFELFKFRNKVSKNCENYDNFNGHIFTKDDKTITKAANRMEYVEFLCSTEKTNVELYDSEISDGEDLFEDERSKIYKHSRTVRDELIACNYHLIGEVIKESKPKLPLEELMCSEDYKVYLVQHITFGNELNEAISYLFRIPLKKVRNSKDTYLVFENGNTIELEEKMRFYFMDRCLKINLIDKNRIKM